MIPPPSFEMGKEDDDSQQDQLDTDEPQPICSVLNTVVDFVMRSPSPLEYNEFHHSIPVEVPVLRIFGPILRRDTTRDLAVLPHPVQTACLYIHNAFPYLLARPVEAGPDGSNLPCSVKGQINWDSVPDIERVVPVLMETLEAAIQASGFETKEEKENPDAHRKRMPVIRRITVVEGRGFYTYCPGPSAPFLRVEYYNPSLRWKVKRALERGLEGLPSIYYPENVQYDYSPRDTNLPLSFHCYEAHIPYTMQFFKDYNLSGMAYIHLSDTCGKQHSLVRFRDPLPKRLIGNTNHPIDENFLFLESNTPDSYRWKETSIVLDEASSIPSQEDDHNLSMQQQQLSETDPSPASLDFVIKKETSCGLELDVSVEAIVNVLSVMTDIEEEDVDTVHWRAVPSLREIWQEERRRMAKLVPPANDFLSQKLTLNVKKGAAKPGARLAVQGMRQLVNVTPGLQENFQRVLKEIVERHSGAIQRVDDYLRQHPAVTPRVKAEPPSSFTPTNDEALEDLGALGEFFGALSQSPAAGSQDEISIELLSSQLSQNNMPLSQSDQRFKKLSQSYYDLRQSQMDDCPSAEFEMSQRVDRGEGIVVNGPYEELDDFIDPQTLRPYDDVGEDDEEDEFGREDMSEDQMEKELHELATQPFIQVNDMENSFSIDSPHEAKHDPLQSKDSWEVLEELREGSAEMQTETIQPKCSVAIIPQKLTLLSHPPSREGVLSGSKTAAGLCAMHSQDLTPKWMRHLYLYNKRKQSRKKLDMPQRDGKCRFHLVRQPPDREAVLLWHKTDQKKTGKSNLTKIGHKVSIKETAEGLELDGNSRELVVGAHSADKEVEETKVADADWLDDSCPQPMRTTSASVICEDTPQSASPTRKDDLEGMGNQGGRLWAKTRPSQMNSSHITQSTNVQPYLPSPVTLMVLEVHVQCRTGRAGVNDSKTISMTPNSDRDKVSAVVYVFGRDPGGGEALETIERGCIFVPVGKEIESVSKDNDRPFETLAASVRRSMPREVLGVPAPLTVESVRDERQLLLRIASIIRLKDPDMLLSWDTQGLGTGYLIERGIALGKEKQTSNNVNTTSGSGTSNAIELDLARLFGRTPTYSAVTRGTGPSLFFPQSQTETRADLAASANAPKGESRWKGSGLGVEWDDRVGAGAAAASVVGRISFAVWKIVAEEVKHPNCSYLPAVASSVLNKRIPFHDNIILSQWYGYNNGKERWRVLHHRLLQATCSLLLFDALDMIGRSGEAARLSGVEFSQSFPGIRGSQYKVEGVLLRALKSLNANERGSKKGRKAKSSSSMPTSSSLTSETKSQSQSPWKARRRERGTEEGPFHDLSNRSYFFYSPSLMDSDKQEALEVQALTLEPQSGHHHDPIVVCDFTALYPSLVIAYNLCYSTCAGRLDYHSTRSEMRSQGKTKGRLGPFHYSERRSASVFKHHIRSMDSDRLDRAYVAPTGTIFVSEEVVKGVLPQVLDEMLSTRAMLKKAAKLYKKNVPNLSPSILRQLEARQLALKYVANVTYGYTSATFSGRCAMPLLADTIVECARRTLNNAINLANRWGKDTSGKWSGCEVLYGDTDSVFIKLPGRSVLEGFQFGEEFCAAVTSSNPPPVQLKLEKSVLGMYIADEKEILWHETRIKGPDKTGI